MATHQLLQPSVFGPRVDLLLGASVAVCVLKRKYNDSGRPTEKLYYH